MVVNNFTPKLLRKKKHQFKDDTLFACLWLREHWGKGSMSNALVIRVM